MRHTQCHSVPRCDYKLLHILPRTIAAACTTITITYIYYCYYFYYTILFICAYHCKNKRLLLLLLLSFDYSYQNALRQAIVFSMFSFVKSRSCVTRIKDCSEMHSGSCSEMTPSYKCLINAQYISWHYAGISKSNQC